MVDDQGRVRQIAWREIFPWLLLARGFGIASSLRVLLLGAAGLCFTFIGLNIITWMFSGSEDTKLQSWVVTYSQHPWQRSTVAENMQNVSGEFSGLPSIPSPGGVDAGQFGNMQQGPYLGPFYAFVRPWIDIFSLDIGYLHVAFLLLCGIWVALVWGVFGGAITRVAAMGLGREERISLKSALNFSLKAWKSYFFSPLFPILGVLAAVLLLTLAGLLFQVGVFQALGGVLWIIPLLMGVAMATLLVGALFGWPLMWPALSSEGTDSFDALSRSYDYVTHRPLHLLFYAIVSIILGALGWLLVTQFASAVMFLPKWGLSWGSGSEVIRNIDQAVATGNFDTGGVESSFLFKSAANTIFFWQGVVRLLVLAFAFGFFLVSSTAIYLLLRRSADGTMLDEIYVDGGDMQHSLPPLTKDSAGVAVVADVPPANGGGSAAS